VTECGSVRSSRVSHCTALLAVQETYPPYLNLTYLDLPYVTLSYVSPTKCSFFSFAMNVKASVNNDIKDARSIPHYFPLTPPDRIISGC
jgi:hypothetical protein